MERISLTILQKCLRFINYTYFRCVENPITSEAIQYPDVYNRQFYNVMTSKLLFVSVLQLYHLIARNSTPLSFSK